MDERERRTRRRDIMISTISKNGGQLPAACIIKEGKEAGVDLFAGQTAFFRTTLQSGHPLVARTSSRAEGQNIHLHSSSTH